MRIALGRRLWLQATPDSNMSVDVAAVLMLMSMLRLMPTPMPMSILNVQTVWGTCELL